MSTLQISSTLTEQEFYERYKNALKKFSVKKSSITLIRTISSKSPFDNPRKIYNIDLPDASPEQITGVFQAMTGKRLT